MQRLLIYLTYDKQNIIDNYIGYFLQSMQSITDSIAVVCNMPFIEKGLHNLSDYADNIFYRENIGLDAGGFKDALCTFVGWDKIRQYDEIILSNDSFYGPFSDIGRIFTKMEEKKLDFWGLMKRGAGEYGTTGKDPEHILSFFYVFQAPLIHSREFRNYWENMPYYKDYMTVVKKYERQLTKHFADLGYKYDAYSDTSPNESKNPRNQFFQCDYLSYEMITKRNFPFLKRKQMAYNTLYCQTQENLSLSIEYIDKCTDYDVNLIWENLIRTQHPTELQRSLGLQFILGDSREIQKKYSGVVVCVQVKWRSAADTVCEYLMRIRNKCDILIFANSEDVMEAYFDKGLTVIRSDNSSLDMLQTIDTGKYQYICLIHDFDLSSEQIPSCSGKSYFYNIWENLIKNAGYIDKVINLFETKKYIGMLMHPVPIFGVWMGRIGFEWTDRYDEVKDCLNRFGIEAVINRAIPPINVTDNFWVRAEVIDFVPKRQDFDSICDYLWNYIVQANGKLTGIIESASYASMNETNYHYYLRTFLEWFTKRYGEHENMHEFQEVYFVDAAAEECRTKYEDWYIYGTGEIAERCFDWINDASAFIVSDGYSKSDTFHGKPVIYLSELGFGNKSGVILCLSKENKDRVIDLLKEQEVNNYYAIN